MTNYVVIDFAASRAKIDERIASYNKLERELASRSGRGPVLLREQHMELCYSLLRLHRIQLYQLQKSSAYSADPNALPAISVNNQTLSQWRHAHPSTIWRRKQRLLEAGILTGYQFHGTRQDYEIRWAVGLLVVENHQGKASESVNAGLLQSLPIKGLTESIAECKPTLSDIQVTNKENKPVLKGVKVPSRITRFPRQERPDPLASPGTFTDATGNSFTGNKSSHERENADEANTGYQRKLARKDAEFEELRQRNAQSTVLYAIALLWPKVAFFEDYLMEVIDYVRIVLYGRCYTFTDLNRTHDEFRRRLALAGKYQQLHPEYRAPFPRIYFDEGNALNGFGKTSVMLKKSHQWAEHRDKERARKIRDQEKLTSAVRLFLSYPNLDHFRKAETYVKRHVPHLMDDFYRQIIPAGTSVEHPRNSAEYPRNNQDGFTQWGLKSQTTNHLTEKDVRGISLEHPRNTENSTSHAQGCQ